MAFIDIIGQEAAIQIIRDELLSGRLHHAYLFMGKEGMGKKTLALQFARALNCREEEADSCDSCLSCRKIMHFNHPDVRLIEIEEGYSIKIEQIRELQKDIVFKPYETERKLYIIDGADRMTDEAANSLLKTLEEPPKYAIIILLAEEGDKMLPTVISRCQQLSLAEIPVETLEELLLERGADRDTAALLARLAEGSPGYALRMLEEEEYLSLRRDLLDFLKYLPETDAPGIFEKSEEIARIMDEDADRTPFPVFDLLLNWYRDIILYNQGAQKQIINIDYMESIKALNEIYRLEELIGIIEEINNTRNMVNSNVKKELALGVLFFKIRSKRV